MDGIEGFMPEDATGNLEISVVFPCLNEVESVGDCVREALRALAGGGLSGEVLVVDNGSTDGSVGAAMGAGARVVFEPRRGYGNALRAGIAAAQGSIVVMADADLTYDLGKIPQLVGPILHGEADLVLGSRLDGATRKTMALTHRFAGTPALSFLIARASGSRTVKDSQTGLRAFRRQAIVDLGLRSAGMEFASEMLIRAAQSDLRIVETPTGYRPRVGESKLNSFQDGWRHIQLILLLAPHLLLVGPGAVLLLSGLALSAFAFVSPGGVILGSLRWQPVFFSSIALVLGTQALLVGALLAHHSSVVAKKVRDRFNFVGRPRFASACLVGGISAILLGLGVDLFLFLIWLFGRATPSRGLPAAAFAQSLIIVGSSVASFGFVRRLILGGVSGERFLPPDAHLGWVHGGNGGGVRSATIKAPDALLDSLSTIDLTSASRTSAIQSDTD